MPPVACQLLLLLLASALLLPIPSGGGEAAANWSTEVADLDDGGDSGGDGKVEAEFGIETPVAGGEGGDQRNLLMKLSQLLRQELSRRSRVDGLVKRGAGIADLADIADAAAKFGVAVGKEAIAGTAPATAATTLAATTAAATTATTTMPEPEAVTGGNSTTTAAKSAPNIFVALWLMLRKLLPLPALIAVLAASGLVILLIIILIVYCCCCRKSSRLSRSKPLPQSVLYKDLDLTGANRPPFGIINYSLEYDLNKDNLLVTVSNCQDLRKGLDSLDPYVVLSIMTEKDEAEGRTRGAKTKTSKTVRNTSNPVFNFACVFPVKKKSELKEKILVFEVFDWDYGIKHDMVARKVIHLRRMGEGLDEILGRSADFTKPLKKGLPRDERGPGDICLSLYYAAKDMSLTVTIVECKGVFVTKSKEEPDLETLPNTFVRLTLRHPQLKREQVKRSKSVRASRNPYFNQQFVFEVGGPEQLETCILRVALVHTTDTLRIKRSVGALELHSAAEPDSLPLLHWRELRQTPNRATARWHNLITPEAEERSRKLKEKEEKRRMQELQEEAESAGDTAAKR